MQKRKPWFPAALAVPIIVLAGYLFFQPTEPSYMDRPLRLWIQGYRDGKAEFSRTQIDEAVHAMGTNAIPFLVKWMDFEPVRATGKLALAVSGLIKRFNPSWAPDREKHLLSSCTISGFRALGPEGYAAIGPLQELLKSGKLYPGGLAATSLAMLGWPGIPPILSAMTNDKPNARFAAVRSCGLLGSNAWLAVPHLIQRRIDTSEAVQEEATSVLLQIRRRPETKLPGIMANLENPERWIRLAAMVSLSELPEFETNAVPGLQRALMDLNPEIRADATNALRNSALPKWTMPR
jgi:hypothetical protein